MTTSESQELIARILGFRDWNVLAARINEAANLPVSAMRESAPTLYEAGIPLIPMRDLVLFPHMISRIFVARDKSRQAVERAISSGQPILIVAQRHGKDDYPDTLEALHSVGVMASVIDRQTQVDGTLKVTVRGLKRTRLIRLFDGECLAAEIAPIEEQRGQSKEAAALSSAVLDRYQAYAEVDYSALPLGSKARFSLPSIGDSSLLADTVAPLLTNSIEVKQQILEASDVVTRLEGLVELMRAGRPKAVA
ncbi:LON peptidase substrate-binding domain-containing protein [Rhizobium sp. Rhizsp42]|uniref:LON peptidase substrate-binding domain-containing protein n=1 Tax=Rhizobium sp. Rhizsp42 TaxID=3243034 RepID=UPI0039B09445